MIRTRRWLATFGSVVAIACSPPETGTQGGQWRSYGGDPGSRRYAPLDQIDAENFDRLEIAWTWESADIAWKARMMQKGRRRPNWTFNPDIKLDSFQCTPLMVDGVLYGVTPADQVFALDAVSGRLIWLADPQTYRTSRPGDSFTQPKSRGVTYWRSGDDARIFLATHNSYLVALDAKDGSAIESFGVGGRVDLLADLRPPKPRRMQRYFHTSPAALAGDTLIVGSSIGDRPNRMPTARGELVAYDARTGAHRWSFHLIPEPGEVGADTWEDGSLAAAGSANVWGPMTVDAERGLLFAPTSTPTNDHYGGHRPGDNWFAESIVALDTESGQRRWHRQLIHHGIWDYDISAPPNLVEIEVEGRPIDAVVQLTKHGFAFVFDRETGEPVWPIEERPVPQSDVPGEQTSATQPFPTKPPPFARQGLSEQDLVDFTPALHEQALASFGRLRSGPLFTPPSTQGTLTMPAPRGGTSWRGAAFDPDSGVLYVPSVDSAAVLRVREGDPDLSDFRYQASLVFDVFLPGHWWKPGKLPLIKPPYSQISAIDLNRGEMLWQVPNGDGPRDHPALEGLSLPRLGSGVHTAVIATRTLLIAPDGGESFFPGVGRPLVYAYDKATGERVGTVEVPGEVRGAPMTYLAGGKQFIVMTVVGEDASDAGRTVATGLTGPQEVGGEYQIGDVQARS